MPKQKTHKGMAKRVTVTRHGKIKRRKAGSGHLLSGKSGKRKRQLRRPAVIEGKLAKEIRIWLDT